MPTEADILATTYTDTCTVIRPTETDESWGETRFEDTPVFEDIPCAVSKSQLSTADQTENVAKIKYRLMLFVRPEIEIKPNDRIIANVQGDIIEARAGKGMKYVSGWQIPLGVEGEA